MSAPDVGATLYLLAHHDDEVFCAGRIWADLIAGRQVRLLWATAGGLAPAGRRQAEGRRVARLLDLPSGTAVSLGWPDQSALSHLRQILEAATWMLGEAGVTTADRVCAPAYEGGHPDHDAMNLVAARLRARHPELRAEEFALYRRGRSGCGGCGERRGHGERGGHSGLAVKAPWLFSAISPTSTAADPLPPAARALRRRLMTANTSQLPTSLGPLAALALIQRTWASEPVRELPQHDYSKPPHEGRPLYESYTRHRFSDFAAAAADFEK